MTKRDYKEKQEEFRKKHGFYFWKKTEKQELVSVEFCDHFLLTTDQIMKKN